MEVCTTVFQPDSSVDCPITFPFTIDFFTTDDSAGMWSCDSGGRCVHVLSCAVTPEDYEMGS